MNTYPNSIPLKPRPSEFTTHTEYARAWRQWQSKFNPEYKKQKAAKLREWRKNNPDKSKKHYHDAYERDKENWKANSRAAWHQDVNASREKCRQRLVNEPWRLMASTSRRRAKQEGWIHDLTPDYIKSIWPSDNCCPVFGTPFKKARRGESRDASPSLERIDSSKGYVKSNVIVISLKANRMKNNGSLEELKRLVEFYDCLTKHLEL